MLANATPNRAFTDIPGTNTLAIVIDASPTSTSVAARTASLTTSYTTAFELELVAPPETRFAPSPTAPSSSRAASRLIDIDNGLNFNTGADALSPSPSVSSAASASSSSVALARPTPTPPRRLIVVPITRTVARCAPCVDAVVDDTTLAVLTPQTRASLAYARDAPGLIILIILLSSARDRDRRHDTAHDACAGPVTACERSFGAMHVDD